MTTKPRLTLADIQARIGAITPLGTSVTKGTSGMPDPGEIEADPIMQAFRLLGRVLDHGRVTTMGWGYDVECPWSDKHSSRIVSGTSYVPVAQKFKCHHGHCQDQGMAEVRVKLDELLRTPPPGGPGTTLAALEFDAVDPALLTLPAGWGAASVAAQVLASYEITEDGVALAFADRHAGQLRFDYTRQKWFVWADWFWRQDPVAHAFKWARMLGRTFRQMQDSNARALGKIAAAGAIERGARCDDQLAVDGLGWDQDPWRAGAPGCEINLATGRVEPPDPAHGITKQLLVAPRTMPTPVWDQFLWDSTGGDPAMIRFLQAWSGYCLTGDVSEEKFVFLYGPGGNGKGTYLYTLTAIMHDYAARTPVELFMTRKHDVHPEHIARLAGVRAVVASEIQAGQTFNVVRLKDFTGRDGKLSGEFKYGHVFEFMAQFKVLFVGNDQPRLPGVDDAIKRRLVLLPFLHKPAIADATLKDRLRDEYPGILQWMIDGENLRRTTTGGLTALVPAAAERATTAYLEEQDVFRVWADERCRFGPGEQMKIGEGFEDYRGWCAVNDCQPEVGERQFSRKFLVMFPRCRFVRTAQARILEGVSLLPTSC